MCYLCKLSVLKHNTYHKNHMPYWKMYRRYTKFVNPEFLFIANVLAMCQKCNHMTKYVKGCLGLLQAVPGRQFYVFCFLIFCWYEVFYILYSHPSHMKAGLIDTLMGYIYLSNHYVSCCHHSFNQFVCPMIQTSFMPRPDIEPRTSGEGWIQVFFKMATMKIIFCCTVSIPTFYVGLWHNMWLYQCISALEQ